MTQSARAQESQHTMDIDHDTLESIRVLVCLADEDQATDLAHQLREHGLDVLVAHRIRAAMRVMEKESPQAVVVEVATTAYDGFRVAQWAGGRVMAIFLVAGRPLTLMEDVEVLKAGAKEVFYTPLQASTIAASIRGACGADTKNALGPEAAEPKTRFSAPSTVMNRDHGLANTARRDVVPWDGPDEGGVDAPDTLAGPYGPNAMAASQGELDTLIDPSQSSDSDASAASMQEQIRQQVAAQRESRPPPTATYDHLPSGDMLIDVRDVDVRDTAVEHPTLDPMDFQDDFSAEEHDASSALVADLFDDPISTPARPHVPVEAYEHADEPEPEPEHVPMASYEPEPEPETEPERVLASEAPTNRPKSRKIEAPPDDDLLVSGMMEDLDSLDSDSLYGGSRQAQDVEESEQGEGEAPDSEAAEDGEADNEQTSPTERSKGPSTQEIIAAAYGTSKTPQRIATLLTVAVVCAGGWLGWLALERSGALLPAPAQELELTPEEEAARAAIQKLHGTLSEAAISHREGDLAAAKSGYEDALQQDPESHVAMRGLAAIAMTSRDWKETRKALNRLAMVEPDDPSLPLQQGLILKQLGQDDPSRAELRRFIDSTSPEDPRVRPAAQVYLSLTRGE